MPLVSHRMLRSLSLRSLSRSPLAPRPLRYPLQTPLQRSFSSFPSKDVAELDTVTRLPNGIRVATEALPGHFSGIGVYIDAGSRYENERLRGVSHLVDRLAFKSTTSRTSENMLEALETFGGAMQCTSSRESLMYQTAVFNNDVPEMLGIIAETIRDPLMTEEEVSQQLDTAAYEIMEIWSKPELILPEIVHMTAYKNNTLGNPLLCPQERLEHINRNTILEYRDAFYRPERIVIAFVGVDHSTAVGLVERYFGDMKSTGSAHLPVSSQPSSRPLGTYPPPHSSTSGIISKIPLIKNISTSAPRSAEVHASPFTNINPLTTLAHYTGGIAILPPSDIPSHLPTYTHLHIAFEGIPITDPEIYASATLQVLLGGGGSFSAGGPGKGMFTRLFTNVLNQHGWIESCIAYNHAFLDSGLFGIAASCHIGRSSLLAEIVMKELAATFTTSRYWGLQKAEVERAKKQLQSSLLMNLESRMVGLEDLGRQVQVHGKRISMFDMCAEIERLTVEDIRRVAERIFVGGVHNPGMGTGKPTIVVQGTQEEIEGMGDLESVARRYNLGRQ